MSVECMISTGITLTYASCSLLLDVFVAYATDFQLPVIFRAPISERCVPISPIKIACKLIMEPSSQTIREGELVYHRDNRTQTLYLSRYIRITKTASGCMCNPWFRYVYGIQGYETLMSGREFPQREE